MRDIKKTAKIVEHILEKSEKARNSDSELYGYVCLYINPEVIKMPFLDVLANQKALGIPKFETVRRSRQKIQETRPDLRAKKEVEDMRYENWKAVLDFVSE